MPMQLVHSPGFLSRSNWKETVCCDEFLIGTKIDHHNIRMFNVYLCTVLDAWSQFYRQHRVPNPMMGEVAQHRSLCNICAPPCHAQSQPTHHINDPLLHTPQWLYLLDWSVDWLLASPPHKGTTGS